MLTPRFYSTPFAEVRIFADQNIKIAIRPQIYGRNEDLERRVDPAGPPTTGAPARGIHAQALNPKP